MYRTGRGGNDLWCRGRRKKKEIWGEIIGMKREIYILDNAMMPTVSNLYALAQRERGERPGQQLRA